MCTVRKLIFRYYRRNADVSKRDVGENIAGRNMHSRLLPQVSNRLPQ